MAEKVLRPDQAKVIEDLYFHLNNGKTRPLIVMPTGSGKTFVAANQVKDAVEVGHKIIFMVNRDALIKQAYEEFQALGVPVGAWAGEHKELINKNAPVQIASAQTLLVRGIDFLKPTLVYLDEAHLTAYSSAAQPYLSDRRTPVIGLTATPYRLSSDEEMGDKFNALITGLLPWEMFDKGFLKRPIYYDLSQKYDIRHPSAITFLIKEWKRLAEGRKTICFTSGVEQAHAIAAAFTEAGIPFAGVDGTMSSQKRTKIYQSLEKGDLLGVCSCDSLSEGFNIPEISCVAFCRDTDSRAKYYQQIGRGLRAFPGIKDCLALDLAGVIEKFGGMEEILEYSLTTSKEKGESDRPLSKKTCPSCQASIFAFLKKCDCCQHKFPAKEMPLLTLEEQMLQKVPAEHRFQVLGYRRSRQRAFKNRSSLASVEQAFKFPPPYAKGAVFGGTANALSKGKFLQRLREEAIADGHDDNWVQQEFFKEFGNLG